MAKVGDLFPDYKDYSWIKGKGNVTKRYGKRNKTSLARGIFHTFLNLVMDDVVEGNVLKFPKHGGMLYIEHPTDYVVQQLKEQGKLRDFESAGIREPAVVTYRFRDARDLPHKYRVIMDKKRYKRMLRYLFEGKKYSHNIGIW